MLRGNERKDIFLDDADRVKFLDVLYTKKADEGCSLYAYCLMDNHIHLVVREGTDSIARLIKRVGSSYVRYFNQKYKRVGHLFQDRYKSENIETDSYLLTVIRYVHQNPRKAGITEHQKYRWSSYHAYLEALQDRRYVPEMAEILDIFAGEADVALERFQQFHQEYSNAACLDVHEAGYWNEEKRSELHGCIREILQNSGLTLADLAKAEHSHIRQGLILRLKDTTGLSGRKLAELTGINREVIRKILAKPRV
ncbi:transposase [Sporomusa sphaeroides]|uniref:transposase n=1 Tax=Sporomusa sphaeroides TaxID=47679 RepID=UPI002D1FC18A|nr:transposase [Sporomusa sphaeroides]